MLGSIRSRVLGFAVCIAAFVAVAMATANFFRIDRIESALIGVGMVVLAALAAILFGRRLVAPIDNLARTMDLLAEGRTDMVICHLERRDEIGAMARAVEVFRESKAKVDRMIEDDRLSLERRQARMERRDRRVISFEQEMSSVSAALAAAAGQMASRSDRLGEVANATAASASVVASAAAQSTANVEAVAAATEELSASIQDIVRQVSESSAIARIGGTGRADQRDCRGARRCRQPDRRDRRLDQLDRGSDQSPGAECHHRSGTGRRGRQGLRRRRD